MEQIGIRIIFEGLIILIFKYSNIFAPAPAPAACVAGLLIN